MKAPLIANNSIKLADAVNHNFGKLLAVAIQFLIALAALLLEDQDFIALNVGDNRAFYGNVQLGGTDAQGAVVVGQQGVAELYRVTDVAGQTLGVNKFISLNLSLLAGDINNGVHLISAGGFSKGNAKVRRLSGNSKPKLLISSSSPKSEANSSTLLAGLAK